MGRWLTKKSTRVGLPTWWSSIPEAGVCLLVLLLASQAWRWASPLMLVALLSVGGGLAVLQQPRLGLIALIFAALLAKWEIGTGSEVALNPTVLLVPTLLVLWLLDMIRRRNLHLVPSRTNIPLFLFLLANLFSLLVGNVLWDPAVPRSGHFIIVQLAQWSIFAFSAGAFWLTGNLVRKEIWLRRLTFLFLALAGGLAVLHTLTGADGLADRLATDGLTALPFWLLLTALAGGQLLFNQRLSVIWRLFLLVSLGAVVIYALYQQRESISNWVGVTAVAGVLVWLRWSRLRWLAVVLLLVLGTSGVLFSAVYHFAGGDEEWQASGSSRLVLICRVVEVTMRNPITGLGPAAYRVYARMKPLQSGNALYFNVNVSSHNNYVDLFSHAGLLGLGLFLWFTLEVTRLGFRLRSHYTRGFAAGYVNAMLAAWAGALVVMLLADFILPFVYNIGFRGFQGSVLLWVFLGGMVALEQIAGRGGKHCE